MGHVLLPLAQVLLFAENTCLTGQTFLYCHLNRV
jgi:hypothetical protein